MLILQLITVLLVAIDVRLDLLNGDAFTGSLTSISPQELTLEKDGKSNTIALEDIVSVTTDVQISEPSDQGRILLADGSQIECGLESLTAQQARSETSAVGPLVIPRAALRAVRLSSANPDWDEQWNMFLKRTNENDLLILKKRDGTGLDFYGGIVSAVSGDNVDFVLDGDTVPVPRSRIYGLIFAANTTASTGTTTIQFADGSAFIAQSLITDGDGLTVLSSWDQTLKISLETLHRIDFSGGRFHYLSDLDPVKETYFGIHPDGSLLAELLKSGEVLSEDALNLWKLHRDKIPMGPFGPLPLTLRGKVYRKGIWLFPRCRIDYALDSRYTAFQTIAGVDDEVAFNCSQSDNPSKVQLSILTDGDEAWNQVLDAPADPLTIDLDVRGVRTLSILVDFGDDDSACDFLDLANARLLIVP
ncbi:MAG: NPCBM/NEW2 domain-containing protein [Fuerstiella sp.]|nr:NPCBM/NEW2 domain-containing protein [Fuerstiella sp.]